MSTADPILENWYQDPASGRIFRVVAIDPENDSIDVQYSDGDIAEYEFTSWEDADFFPVDPPEDWSAPFDDVEIDDLGYSDPDLHGPHLQEVTLDDILNGEEER